MPLKLKNDRSTGVDPQLVAFLQRILKSPRAASGIAQALGALSVTPLPAGMAVKGPELAGELGAQATAGMSDEEIEMMGDLLGSSEKAAPKLVAPEAAKPVTRAVERASKRAANREAAEGQRGEAIHDLLGKLRTSDKHVRELQLRHARELSERLGLPVSEILKMLNAPHTVE